MLVDVISGLVADVLRLINVNAGGFRLKKGQGILHPNLTNNGSSGGETHQIDSRVSALRVLQFLAVSCNASRQAELH